MGHAFMDGVFNRKGDIEIIYYLGLIDLVSTIYSFFLETPPHPRSLFSFSILRTEQLLL
jgi:hypothetical protein